MTFLADPQAELDWTINWQSNGYLESGETLQTVDWKIPAGLTEVSRSNDTTTATITLSGYKHAIFYTIVCVIQTTKGRKDERSIYIKGWEPI